MVLKRRLENDRKAVSSAQGPRIPKRQSVPMKLGKVEMQVIESEPPTPGVSNFHSK